MREGANLGCWRSLGKGPDRPLNGEIDRACVLAALESVSLVTLFDEATPVELLKLVRADIYVKGGDYTLDTIDQAERRVVESYGGRIVLLSGVEGRGTTNIIDKIRQE